MPKKRKETKKRCRFLTCVTDRCQHTNSVVVISVPDSGSHDVQEEKVKEVLVVEEEQSKPSECSSSSSSSTSNANAPMNGLDGESVPPENLLIPIQHYLFHCAKISDIPYPITSTITIATNFWILGCSMSCEINTKPCVFHHSFYSLYHYYQMEMDLQSMYRRINQQDRVQQRLYLKRMDSPDPSSFHM